MSIPHKFSVWSIADLHLSFGIKNKSMEIFGKEWEGWTDKIENHWRQLISNEDLVLIPGDMSWAMRLEDVIPDLEWIDRLPGTKVMIRGNHDYWWASKSKVEKILPKSIHIIQNNAFHFHNVSIGGARLWDTCEYHFSPYIIRKENEKQSAISIEAEPDNENEKIFMRELSRLEMSLKEMDKKSVYKIAMTHYPPIGAELKASRASDLLEKYHIDVCVFGHLHSVKPHSLPFGEKNKVRYALTACDYLNFTPIKIFELKKSSSVMPNEK